MFPEPRPRDELSDEQREAVRRGWGRGVEALVGIGVLASSFWGYAQGRILAETVGLTVEGTLAGLFVAATLPALVLWVILLLRLLYRLWRGNAPSSTPRLTAVVFVCLAIGSTTCETWFLVDEARFARETEVDPTVPYSRARPWPFGSAGLTYLPGKGIRAHC